MAKVKSKWVCQNCGYESAGYLGKCPECSSWGSFVEEVQTDSKTSAQNSAFIPDGTKAELISDIQPGKKYV